MAAIAWNTDWRRQQQKQRQVEAWFSSSGFQGTRQTFDDGNTWYGVEGVEAPDVDELLEVADKLHLEFSAVPLGRARGLCLGLECDWPGRVVALLAEQVRLSLGEATAAWLLAYAKETDGHNDPSQNGWRGAWWPALTACQVEEEAGKLASVRGPLAVSGSLLPNLFTYQQTVQPRWYALEGDDDHGWPRTVEVDGGNELPRMMGEDGEVPGWPL